MIFAKAHAEKKWAFHVASEMPKLDYEEMKTMAHTLGIREVGEDYIEEGDAEGYNEKRGSSDDEKVAA